VTRPYTARQEAVLEAIRDALRDRGLPPTLQEIGRALGGISRVAVLDHLRALERKGALRRRARESRAIEVLDPRYRPARALPLLGRVAAGRPIEECEDREDVTLEEFLGAGEGTFLLRVAGESMVGAHIVDGDLVLVEARATARDGETVVAVVDGEATLKRLYRETGGRIRLEPANPAMRPLVLPEDSVAVRGVVRGVIRRT
jgi:repressor LexA